MSMDRQERAKRKRSKKEEVDRRVKNKQVLLSKLTRYLKEDRVLVETRFLPGQVFKTHSKRTSDTIQKRLKAAGVNVELKKREEFVVGLDSGQWQDGTLFTIIASKPRGWKPKGKGSHSGVTSERSAPIGQTRPKISGGRQRITPKRPRIGK